MYGGASKPESYCNITVYLQHNAPLLYENIQDLCLFGVFNTRGRNSVTFLLPDKKTQEKIDKLVGQDARKAVAMINACVLPVYLESLEDFRTQQADIPNKLGNKLPIKEVTSSSVELSNGAKITRDSKFKRLYDTSNVAVYSLDGEVPTTGDSSQVLSKKKGSSSGRAQDGGSYHGGDDDQAAFGYSVIDTDQTYNPVAMIRQLSFQTQQMCKWSFGPGNDNNSRRNMDPCSHNGVSLLKALEMSDKELEVGLFKVFTAFHPVSPLYYPFMLCVVDGSFRAKWPTLGNKYNNATERNKQVALGASDRRSSVNTLKDSAIRGFAGLSVCKQALELFTACVTKVIEGMGSEGEAMGPAIDHYFGGVSQLSMFVVVVGEYCHLMSEQYLNAWFDGGPKGAETINDIFNLILTYAINLMQNGVKSVNLCNALLLLNPKLADMDLDKFRFCTILSLVMNSMFPPLGGDVVKLAGITTDNTNRQGDAIYCDSKITPTTIIPTSKDHLYARQMARMV